MVSNPVGHGVNHVIVDLVCDFVREVRSSVQNTFARKRGCILGEDKYRHHAPGQNRSVSFHTHSLPFR